MPAVTIAHNFYKVVSKMRFPALLVTLFLISAKAAHGKKNLLRFSDNAERLEETMFSERSLLNKARQLGQAVVERKDLDLNVFCPALEMLFQDDMTCECNLDITQPSSISCTLNEPVCTPNNSTCGRPSLQAKLEATTFMLDEITACVYDYKQNGQEYEDLCVTADFCTPDGGFFTELCDCSVSYGGTECNKCDVCKDVGLINGIELNCTNINAQVVTQTCQGLDFTMDVDKGEAGSLRAFLPELEGICTQLENITDNAIKCDCSSDEGDTFDLSCETNNVQCAGDLCGQVSSSVSVVDGTVDEVQACVEVESPFLLETTCTTLQLCPDKLDVCGCSAVYNGTACDRCEICDLGDGKKGVSVDCSKADEKLVIKGGCQEVTVASSYSFVPEFERVSDSGSGSSVITTSLSVLALGFVLLGWMG